MCWQSGKPKRSLTFVTVYRPIHECPSLSILFLSAVVPCTTWPLPYSNRAILLLAPMMLFTIHHKRVYNSKTCCPKKWAGSPEKITADTDSVIVGMHTHKDNPELTKAIELGLPVYSYPEFIYQQSQQKQRVVIAGSHGKTTITAMILHVLKYHNRLFDYWIGSPVNGFDITVRLSENAPIIIIEGDEYASAPVDSHPTFLQYHPHIALISGIAWDHVNLYSTWEEYVDQFESLAEAMPKAGILIFDESDDMLDVIGQKDRPDITKIPYVPHPANVIDGKTYLRTKTRQANTHTSFWRAQSKKYSRSYNYLRSNWHYRRIVL